MDPMLISALLAGATQATKLGTGIAQKRKGQAMAEGAIRPEYQTPESAQKAVAIAKMMSAGTLPGAGQFRSDISQASSQGMGAILETGSPAAVAQMASTLNTQQGQQLENLNIREAQYQTEQQRGYAEALKCLGGYEDKEFQLNEYDPFLAKAKAAESLTGAGMQNIQSGIEGVGTAGINYLGTNEIYDSNSASSTDMNDIINKIYGNQGTMGNTDLKVDPNLNKALVVSGMNQGHPL